MFDEHPSPAKAATHRLHALEAAAKSFTGPDPSSPYAELPPKLRAAFVRRWRDEARRIAAWLAQNTRP
jgi:hypothetical protein